MSDEMSSAEWHNWEEYGADIDLLGMVEEFNDGIVEEFNDGIEEDEENDWV